MINTLIEAISIALNGEFGDDYEIHMEEIKQDLKEPCFFISCINPTSSLFVGKRYFRENLFCIQYFPEQKGRERKECNAVAERLFFCLEWLEADGELVKGTRIKGEVVNGILNFFVNYDMFVSRVGNPVPEMGGITREISAKEQEVENNGSEKQNTGKTGRSKS